MDLDFTTAGAETLNARPTYVVCWRLRCSAAHKRARVAVLSVQDGDMYEDSTRGRDREKSLVADF